MCTNLNISACDLLTEDVTTHNEFMKVLADVAISVNEYFELSTVWKGHQSFIKKNSSVSVKHNNVEKSIQSLKTGLVELAGMRVVATNLTLQLQSCQAKLSKMTMLLPVFFDAKHAIEDIIPNLQSCIRAQKQRKFNKMTGGKQFVFLSNNSIGLTWDVAIANLDELEFSNKGALFPLNAEQLKLFPVIKDRCHKDGIACIPDWIVCQVYDIDYSGKERVREIIYQLIDHFPLVGVEKGHYVLIDYCEMIFHPSMVHEMMSLDKPDESDTDSNDQSYPIAERNEGIMFYRQPGPIPLQTKFPQLLTVMLDFIKLHGFAAHMRRRSATSTTCGVGLNDIREHVLKNVEGLTKISRSKIYNLLKPAKESSIEASRHKDCLDVRVGVKCCDISKASTNAHEYFAMASVIRQMCAEFPDEAIIFSCDSKAKIHIGGQAVSRYHQIRTFFPNDDMPHYCDHDFPVPGYLIEPDGFLLKSKGFDRKTTTDKIGRTVIDTPSTGPLWVYNRCVKSTTIVDHLGDLADLLMANPELNRPVLALLCDGGCDWSPKSNLTQFFLGRFWKENNYDMLFSVCHAPGLSRYNPIEHLWAPCSRWLAGVSLSACAEGESVPPAYQTISPTEKEEKEKLVFEKALSDLNSYWDGKTHDGFHVTSKGVTEAYSTEYKDFDLVKEMLKSSNKSIKACKQKEELLDEWKYYIKHMDRRRGFVCFRKGVCNDRSCDCSKNMVRAINLMKLPVGEKWSFPPITKDSKNPEHYMTFDQLKSSLSFSNPDEHLKDGTNESCMRCRYVFTSEADKERHTRLIHSGTRSREESESTSQSKKSKVEIKCPVCGEIYPTRYQLQKHQTEKNHKLGRGRPKKK
ncbi:uncharacterized protein [Dysidea avara]|uniref:uncharacterized protein n=1 Tax=Dysidea avara TaxID=196820 RepID=UPI0033167FEA